ncbi:MAG: MASE1 domain-containing protein, partial [Acidobacteria bacterium]|nr:MASE1 domain-containing protein [Acidobacteriota bacterium]
MEFQSTPPEKRSAWFFPALFTGLLYFAAAWSSNFLVIPPAVASPIWPAAGLAFLCVFRFGNKVLPGLFFAQFIFNFRGISAVTGIHLNSILAPIFPSVGTVLQAYACVWVFRKIIIYRQEDIIKVLLVVPFIGCLVSSS